MGVLIDGQAKVRHGWWVTNFGRVVLVALALGVAAWGCSDDSARDEAPPEYDGPDPGAAPTTVQQGLQTQSVASPKLMRVAPQHLQAVQQVLAQRLSRSGDGLKVESSHDGSRRIKLEGRFSQVLIANQDETGKAHVTCAGSPEEVAKALGN